MDLQISSQVSIPESEIELSAIRARGAGGQNVNKVATAIQLQFDIRACNALPESVRELDIREDAEVIAVIKASALRRLC